METTEKTFRYSYIFKNLGALYLIFLAIVVAIGLIGRDTVFLICIGAMVGGGVIFLTWYLTTSVSVSESNIATKTLLGTKSLKWAEVDRISSRGSSSRLHNHDGDITLSISPRLDGSADVFQEVYNKRADLFDINKYSPFSRSASISVVAFVFGLFLVVIGLAGYLRGISDLTRTLIFGLVMCVYSFINWYSSPRTITLGSKSLDIGYLRKSISIPINEIVSVNLGGRQNQINSVSLLLQNNKVLNLSGYKPAPLVMYYVLKQWHQNHVENQPNVP